MNNKKGNTMTRKEKEELLEKIILLHNEIPTPPPGRNMAVVSTKLDEAKLWLVQELGYIVECK
jgi:hypothetical protein